MLKLYPWDATMEISNMDLNLVIEVATQTPHVQYGVQLTGIFLNINNKLVFCK
jgi:hypothetical protein